MKQHLFILLLFTGATNENTGDCDGASAGIKACGSRVCSLRLLGVHGSKVHLYEIGVLPIIQAVYRKFYLVQQTKTMLDAQTYCKTKHTDLATIENYYEAAQIQNMLQSQNCIASVWIGLYNDVNSWRWSMGNDPLGAYKNWYAPNPDNLGAKESCGEIEPAGWNDYPCTAQLPFICFDSTYTGNGSYIYIDTNMTWSEAQSYCRQYHTDLASARNITENSMIQAMVSGQTWFGLFRDTWKWSDQTKFTSVTWMPGEPNNLLFQENCVFFVNGQAGDVLCSRLKPSVCEAIITGQKQIVKLKVQSSQDANDPAVKAAILDKIKQTVSGLGNVTVKWREQPDGLVFKKINRDSVYATDVC